MLDGPDCCQAGVSRAIDSPTWRMWPGDPGSAGPGVVDVLVGAVPEHVLAFGRPGPRPRWTAQDLGLVAPQRPAREPRRPGLDPVHLVIERVVARALDPDVEPARRPRADP